MTSTIYPCRRVSNTTGCEVKLAAGSEGFVDEYIIINLMDYNTIAICESHVEYSDGQVWNLEVLAEATKQYHALLIVDAIQSTGAIPIDSKNPH